jgi:uncharacterized protein YcaQ
MNITRRDARRFLLVKQGLLGEKRFAGEDGVMAFIRQAGCIQYDPIDVCGRNADLVLQSRVEGYRESMLNSLLYEKRRLVDFWDKNMAIFPVEDWPCFSRTRAEYAQDWVRSFAQVEEVAPAIREALKRQGPSLSGDFDARHKVDWYWSETTASRAVLEALYFRGELGIHHKQGTQKAYDFAENLIPGDILAAPDPYPDDTDHCVWRLKRRIGGVGLLWNKASDAYLGIPDRKAQNRNELFGRLLHKKEIIPLNVEDIRDPLYILSADEELLDRVLSGEEFAPRTQVIAPLDNMLWDRKLLEALFDFYYRWEIYTPREQRQYGYYVLPLLQGEDFVGRIELETGRKTNVLTVKGYWLEKGKKPDKRALNRCLKEFAAFQQVKNVLWPVKSQ